MLREIKSEGELGLFEALANTLPALVRICDADRASIWFNQEWLNFRGRSVESELGCGWLDGICPEDIDQTVELLKQRFEERQVYETKYRLRHHTGQYRWVLHRAAPRFNTSGEFLGFITACVDIHDATVADHERAQFFNVASDILATSDVDGHFDMISDACERVLGWSAAEMADAFDLIHPDDVELTRGNSELLSRGEELIGFENRFRHKDGSYRWLSWRARRDEKTGKVFSAAVDVTERKQFEAELQATIDRHDLAISATNDGIWDWNIRTDELSLSPRYIDLLGLSDPADAPRTATEWRQYLHPDDLAAAKDAHEAFIQGTTSEYRVTFRIRRSDGSWRTVLSRGVALRDEKGVAYQMHGVHSDITEQQEMEAHLRQLKEMAEAANRAKTDFLANMSHE
ncbi:MAG TPA: PAS domain-containing protein, partial [Terriglobales bacterium]|nr:PAS domain-containing protein [Terriglobales bacterium]